MYYQELISFVAFKEWGDYSELIFFTNNFLIKWKKIAARKE